MLLPINHSCLRLAMYLRRSCNVTSEVLTGNSPNFSRLKHATLYDTQFDLGVVILGIGLLNEQ